MRPHSAAALVVGLVSIAWSVGCASLGRHERYAPLQRPEPSQATAGARGTLPGDFAWAAASPSVGEAAERWERFLRDYEPPDGEYEDAFQRYRVDAARLELMRAYYLLGKRAEGDRLLRQLQPPGLVDGQ